MTTKAPPTAQPPEPMQFSLATMLMVVTTICVVIGVLVQLGELTVPFTPLVIAMGMVALGWFLQKSRLMEWGCAVGVIGLVFMCLWPGPSTPREVARRSACNNNLKQIGLALHNHQDTRKTLPARNTTLSDSSPGLSWRVSVLPFLESSPLYNQFRLDEAWDSLHNLPLASQRPLSYACPSAKKRLQSESDYYAIGGPDSCLPDGGPITLSDIKDGTSNTVMVVESHSFRAAWSEPRDLDPATMSWTINQPSAPSSGHPGGAMVLFGDASTRFLSDKTDPQVLQQLSHRRDSLPAADWDQ